MQIKRWNMRAVISTVDIKPEDEGPYVKYEDVEATLANYRGWLQYISDLALGRDGWKNAKDLGELVDELRECAIEGLDEEKAPFPANRKHGDRMAYPGELVAADMTEGTLTIRLRKDWLDSHVIRTGDPCFVRGLEWRDEDSN